MYHFVEFWKKGENAAAMLQRISARAANILRKMTPPQIIAVMFLTIILVGAAILTLLVVSTAYVVGSTNSPFLYFNF